VGAEEFKKQVEFERQIRVGKEYTALWTNSHAYWQAQVRVLAINKQSYRVEIISGPDPYPVGWKLNIPKATNYMRFTWNNRLVPLEEAKK
jgi:hypothetical protein